MRIYARIRARMTERIYGEGGSVEGESRIIPQSYVPMRALHVRHTHTKDIWLIVIQLHRATASVFIR